MSDLKLEPQPADGGGDTNTKTLDAAMLVSTQRPPRAPYRVHTARSAYTSLVYPIKTCPPAPTACQPSGAAGLYVRPISENRAALRPFCTVS